MDRIKIKANEYRELTIEEAKRFFEYDADSLDLIEAGGTAYLFIAGSGAYGHSQEIQSAILEKSSSIQVQNIDEWDYYDINEFADIIDLEGFEITGEMPVIASKENIIKEINFQLQEKGFLVESDRADRFSMILAENLIDRYISEHNIENGIDFKEDFEEEITEEIEQILKDEYCSVSETDDSGDYICYYYCPDTYPYIETVKDLEDRAGMSDYARDFKRLKEVYELNELDNDELEYLWSHQNIDEIEDCGPSGHKIGYNLYVAYNKLYAAYSEEDNEEFEFYVKA
jgi:hypothetical protein